MASANLAVTFFLLAFTGYSHCQYPLRACCDLNLMDATPRVAIDTGRALTPGTYQAFSVRFCYTDPVLIQLWTLLNDNTVQLKWQMSYTPSTSKTARQFFTVPIGSPITVTANDRLGFYGIVDNSTWTKISIPYEVDEIYGSTRFTQAKYDSSIAFTTGLQAQLDSNTLHRTFASLVRLCTASDCSDLPTVTVPTQAPPQDCSCPVLCEPDKAFRDQFTSQEARIVVLQSEIQTLTTMIYNLLTSTVQTGYCPSVSIPGAYGLGSCYIVVRERVQLVQASVRCGQNWNASLVQIESETEENFLFTILANTSTAAAATQVQTFWTSGLYSQAKQQWVWMKNDWTPKAAIAQNSYQNWPGRTVPTPSNDDDLCLVLVTDPVSGTMQWNKASCIAPLNYYICEIPKVCF